MRPAPASPGAILRCDTWPSHVSHCALPPSSPERLRPARPMEGRPPPFPRLWRREREHPDGAVDPGREGHPLPIR
jgi:hypothetical protein